jgi:hypothetical protein
VKEMRQLRRHYDKLTRPERDRLVLAALERQDWDQIRALVERCPAADALPHLWNILALEHMAHRLVIHMLACDALFFRCSMLQSHAQGDGPSPSAARDLLPLLESAAAAWFGFVAGCQTAGLDARQVLNLALPGSEETNPARDLVNRQIEHFENWARRPDPLQIDRWHTTFTRLFWSLTLDSE